MVKNPPANAGDIGSISVSGRSPGERNGNPLCYSCLENSMDRGAWQATVYGGHKTVGHDLATEQQLGKKTLSPYKLLTKSRFNILGGNETETERDWVVWVGNFKLPGNLRVIHTVLPKNMVLLMA